MNNDCEYKQLMPNCKWHYDCRLKIERGYDVTCIECNGDCPDEQDNKDTD